MDRPVSKSTFYLDPTHQKVTNDSGVDSSSDSEGAETSTGRRVKVSTDARPRIAGGLAVDLPKKRHNVAKAGISPWKGTASFGEYDEIKRFMHAAKKLDKEYRIMGDMTKPQIDQLLSPENTQSVTDIKSLIEPYQKMGIKVDYVVADSEINDEGIIEDQPSSAGAVKLGDYIEHERQLTDAELEELSKTVTHRAYKLFLFLQGLQSGLKVMTAMADAELDEPDCDTVAVEKKRSKLNKFNTEARQKMSALTMGLCHAAMKAEMPELYRDDLYTALSIVDKDGYSHFRSDGVQPRSNWMDLRDYDKDGYTIDSTSSQDFTNFTPRS